MNIFNIKISTLMTSLSILTQCVHSMDMDIEQPKTKRSNNTSPPSAILKAQQNRLNTTTSQLQNHPSTSDSQHPYETRQQTKFKQEMLEEKNSAPSHLPTTYHANQLRNKPADLAERYRLQQEENQREIQRENQSKYKHKEIKISARQAIIKKANLRNQGEVIFIEPNSSTQSFLHPMPQTNSTWHILGNHDDQTPYIHLNGQINQSNTPPKTSQPRPSEENQPNLKKKKTESTYAQKPTNKEDEQTNNMILYTDKFQTNYNYQGITFQNYLAANYTPSYHIPINYNYPTHPIQKSASEYQNNQSTMSPETPSVQKTIPQIDPINNNKLDDEEIIKKIIHLISKNELIDSINILDGSMTSQEFIASNSPIITEIEIKEKKVNDRLIFDILINNSINIENNEIKIKTDSLIVYFLQNFPKLKSLTLKNVTRITNHSLYLENFQTDINHIEIYNCPSLTDICIGNILSSNPNLSYLSIEKCPYIRSNWKGIFTKYDLYKLKIDHQNFTDNAKLFIEKNNFEILNSIATRTIQDMDKYLRNDNIIQQTSPTISMEEISYSKIHPIHITLSKYIPENDKIKHLNQDDFANNFLMNIVNTFPSIQKIDLSNTEVNLAGLFHLTKLTNLIYLDIRNTSLKLTTRIFNNKMSLDKLFYMLKNSIREEYVTNSYVDSFFHTT